MRTEVAASLRIKSAHGDILKACNKQHIPLSKVFAKAQDTNNDGFYDKFSYPLVRTTINGKIPVDDSGTVVFDMARVKAALKLADKYDELPFIKAKIMNAFNHVQGFPLEGNDMETFSLKVKSYGLFY